MSPAGHWDSAQRFWPAASEQCACCASVRRPSRAHLYSMIRHCSSVEHVAALYRLSDTEQSEMRRVIRAIDPAVAVAKAAREARIVARQEALVRLLRQHLGNDRIGLMGYAEPAIRATKGAALLSQWEAMNAEDLLDALGERLASKGDSRMAVALRLAVGLDDGEEEDATGETAQFAAAA